MGVETEKKGVAEKLIHFGKLIAVGLIGLGAVLGSATLVAGGALKYVGGTVTESYIKNHKKNK
ncbi:hypothetical protein A3C23_02970 [Candidatus Roizmanbacteria bacterium RIFCSPHIGHO2_02_FULL_37_13b]|uniref:Uncharacterized protein n=1 Tax=Candidatus Roizmanbacteria bacterium RIFCSPLOWO2_02_FULL_36_11 TaxID=1802071 RepID=A0A1F7JI70_9BACT|nr:MAG: hypothetical protein A3C23_02970 [Candidatus Roizmanbacteria bacterium RIFCSPHIGHO2_02_FULL_37_13b]OGK55313.1 MAG: hypothetical protein A3H78_04400 [Candidatus Roizmanbacteria bacterium RIFCSPLOWO2_02_FULL_36_11]